MNTKGSDAYLGEPGRPGPGGGGGSIASQEFNLVAARGAGGGSRKLILIVVIRERRAPPPPPAHFTPHTLARSPGITDTRDPFNSPPPSVVFTASTVVYNRFLSDAAIMPILRGESKFQLADFSESRESRRFFKVSASAPVAASAAQH